MPNLSPGQIVSGRHGYEYEVRTAEMFFGYFWLREVGRQGTIVPHKPEEIRVIEGRGE